MFLIFSDLCVLLLNAWLVHDQTKLLTIISSSLAVILRSLFINTRLDITTSRFKTQFVLVIDSNLLSFLLFLLTSMLLSLSLLLWRYNYFFIMPGDDTSNSLKL